MIDAESVTRDQKSRLRDEDVRDQVEQLQGFAHLEEATLTLPRWIENGSVLRIVLLLLILLTAPALLPWRDTPTIALTVINESPPRSVVVPSGGVITTMLSRASAYVSKGAILAQFADARTITQVSVLETYASEVAAQAARNKQLSAPPTVAVENELQTTYAALARAVTEVRVRGSSQSDKERIRQLERSITALQAQEQQAIRRRDLVGPPAALSDQRLTLKTKAAEAASKTIDAPTRARQGLIEQRLTIQQADQQIDQLHIDIDKAQVELDRTRLDHQLGASRRGGRAQQAAMDLLSAINAWRDRVTVIAPVAGGVKFPIPRKLGDRIPAGAEFAVIVPRSSNVVAIGIVPSSLRANVKKGARVRITLMKYPSDRFGYLEGEVVSIADVASKGGYSVRIRLPNKLRTSNDLYLPVRQRADAIGLLTVRQGRIGDALISQVLARLGRN